MLQTPPSSTLFPYTTLFRSAQLGDPPAHRHQILEQLLLPTVAEGQLVEALHVLLDPVDRKSTRLNSSHVEISYAVFCLKKKNKFCQIAYLCTKLQGPQAYFA